MSLGGQDKRKDEKVLRGQKLKSEREERRKKEEKRRRDEEYRQSQATAVLDSLDLGGNALDPSSMHNADPSWEPLSRLNR